MVFAFASSVNPSTSVNPNTVDDGIHYKGTVCHSVTRANGEYLDLGCNHNLLTNAGKDAIKNALNGGTGTFNYIALCNATAGCAAPAVGDTTLANEYAAGGLSRAAGTYGSLAGNGNWSMAKTFTATADALTTNKTGLFNASSTGTMLAENTFTLVTLYTNDQLTINWTISVS